MLTIFFWFSAKILGKKAEVLETGVEIAVAAAAVAIAIVLIKAETMIVDLVPDLVAGAAAVVVAVAVEKVIGPVRRAITQISLGEMSAIDAKNPNKTVSFASCIFHRFVQHQVLTTFCI